MPIGTRALGGSRSPFLVVAGEVCDEFVLYPLHALCQGQMDIGETLIRPESALPD